MMTQEELDALMSGDLDLDTMDEEGNEEDITMEEKDNESTEEVKESYRASATSNLPPPPTDDNKMVHQLDDVTKESEEKATEIFDIIEKIANQLMQSEEKLQSVSDALQSNIGLFTALTQKFPDIVKFKEQLGTNEAALSSNAELLEVLQNSGDSIMSVMDIMQYQDIHRQKIERVINVMRALSSYMNTLFEGNIADEKRVGSATHLPGDKTTENVVSSDDIEALLKSFGPQ
jgi:chemotaxis regulatin CheY-phosphate phosphatase CheZ